jgi:hypothetical protein
MAFQCDATLRCTFVVWDADVTPEQWGDHLDRIIGDPLCPPGPLLLADLSTARGAPSITTDVIDEMARRWRAYLTDQGDMRWAIVPDGAWVKARRFEADVKGSNIHVTVFNEVWSACNWLGLDRDAALPILKDLREQLRR